MEITPKFRLTAKPDSFSSTGVVADTSQSFSYSGLDQATLSPGHILFISLFLSSY